MVASMKGFGHTTIVHANQAHMLASIDVKVYLWQTNLMQPVVSATHHDVSLLEAAILGFAPDQTVLAQHKCVARWGLHA